MAEGGKLAWVLLGGGVGIRPSVHRLATRRRTVSPRPPRVSTAQAESRVQYSSLIAYGDPSIIYESLEHPHQEGCHRSILAGVVIFRKVPPTLRPPTPAMDFTVSLLHQPARKGLHAQSHHSSVRKKIANKQTPMGLPGEGGDSSGQP